MRVGLVGTGRWAVQVHGRGAASHRAAQLVGVWGRSPQRTARAARELGCPALPSFDDLLDSCDVVSFAVPPDVQPDLARRAAAAGRRLLLEKPLALNIADGRALLDAIGAVPSAVLLTRRWEPRTAAWLRGLVDQAAWTSGRARFANALSEEFLDASPWRRVHGALWDVGPHALSVLEPVLGAVIDVQGAVGPGDLVQLLLRHDSGAVSTAELALTAAAAQTDVTFRSAEGRSAPLPELALDDVLNAYTAALLALATGDATGPDASYGLHLTEVLAQAREALAATGAAGGCPMTQAEEPYLL